eukprot:CAMPEP_0172582172 /NCGR_PEP_ID=MMETSP1068-20121228/1644_1 /TAXON_ID=35684 /ORGANISM="Pseudopedinella elastica, Strain CCMP716" /LENGTH=31 /DNA_ID= /DNA_START= /DNA_END= /DNA_ORIENTATION=
MKPAAWPRTLKAVRNGPSMMHDEAGGVATDP